MHAQGNPMPSYDVECSNCGFEDVMVLKISEVDEWDLAARCPHCDGKEGVYRRVMRKAPASYGGAKDSEKSEKSRKAGVKERFVRSGEKDDMRHRESQKRDRHQIAAAVESVRKGEFEGF
jgi:predicted nucleic acid-binding Zn ribbon protein